MKNSPNRSLLLISFGIGIGCLISFCIFSLGSLLNFIAIPLAPPLISGPTTSIPPTATSAPPTMTPVPPTATSAPPTMTLVLPTATSAPPTMTLVPLTAIFTPPTTTPGGPTRIPVTPTGYPYYPPPVYIPPAFPWPPPDPSASAIVPLGSLGRLAGTGITFHDVDARISNALDAAGYDQKSYFTVPGGFAIVTSLEKTDLLGLPDHKHRWATSLSPIKLTEFSLTDYLQALFRAPEGYYRVFVFIVTPVSFSSSGTPVVQATAQMWIVHGANKLPLEMETVPYTPDYGTTVYIYEFKQVGVGADANQNIPSLHSGKEHLESAGLWENLNADAPMP